MAIAGTLVASAVPRFSHALDEHRLTAATNELVLALHLARSEAVIRKTGVVIAPSAPGDWTRGWRVFVDENRDGRLDAGEPVLREFAPTPQRLSMQPHFGVYDGRALAFDHAGLPRRPGSNGLLLGRMVLRLGHGVRSVCFSAAGVRTVRAAECA
ncbi:MAG: GspH/FimT family pseudopilin [Burkholderiaceae bacterium]|nr:GspH/FimT family pseudopilin [Burkholderiaceae bacterium]MCX8003471.1 GspH/FimT family pseudopilin [Burkholderiaceae bacterium]